MFLSFIFLDIKNILISETEINQKVRNNQKIQFNDINKNLLKILLKIKEVENSRIVLIVDKSSMINEKGFRLNLDDGFLYLYNDKNFK